VKKITNGHPMLMFLTENPWNAAVYNRCMMEDREQGTMVRKGNNASIQKGVIRARNGEAK
jgi:hypothetical protein